MAAAAAVVALSSCSKEESNGVDQITKGKETFMGVSITLPASSAAVRAEDASAGIQTEKDIASIGVYIVEGTTVDYKILYTVSDFTQEVVGGHNVCTAKVAIQTTTGNKKVFVVANPTNEIQSKLVASGSTAMNAAAFGLADNKFLTVAGTPLDLTNMVMSGAYTATSGILDMTVAQTSADALSTPVAITIGRNLAKAVVQEATNYEVTGGTTTLNWTLINKANDAYFISQTAGTLYRTVPATAVSSNTDLYWANFSGMTGVSTDYIGVLPKGAEAKTAAYAQSKYMFENKPSDLFTGNTTAARIKGEFKPDKVFNDVIAGDPIQLSTFTSGQDFYRSNIDGTYWTAVGAAAAISAVYNGHTANTDFTYYKGGVGYYTIYVNDGSGAKGVDRNGYYLMQITEVRGPGSPTENIDPTIPIAEDTNLGVVVTVLNWDYKKSEQIIQ